MPVYPLPTKPFPVLPSGKIGTGFATYIPIEKSGKKARHWRVAHREVRGIAGGRWLAKAWVGEKESDFSALPKDLSTSLAMPKLPPFSASAPIVKAKRAPRAGSSLSASAAPSSRASSVAPPVRQPTKLRTVTQAHNDGLDFNIPEAGQ